MRTFISSIFMVMLLISAWSCKPKQIVREHYIVQTDSSMVASLREELNQKTVELMILKTDITRMRDENMRLQSEITTHVINYDTAAKVNPDGQYPIAQEIISSSKQQLEKKVKEYEDVISHLNLEISSLSTKNANLEYEVEMIKKENAKIDTKPQLSFLHLLQIWIGRISIFVIILTVIIRKLFT